jgi:hypothetical protein
MLAEPCGQPEGVGTTAPSVGASSDGALGMDVSTTYLRSSMRKNATLVRGLHDIGLAGWFGSMAMGAVAVNRAAGDLDDARAVGRVTNGVWRRWWPVNAGFVAAYLVGGLGLTYANRARVVGQRGVFASVTAKNVLTAAALAAALRSGQLGKRVSDAGDVPLRDGTTSADDTPRDVEQAVRQLDILQWALPALTAGLIVLSALQGEQQRPSNVVAGVVDRLTPGR